MFRLEIIRLIWFISMMSFATGFGCATRQEAPYRDLKRNIDLVFARLNAVDDGFREDFNASLPRTEAAFCIDSAQKSARRAYANRIANNILLGGAALSAGIGLSLATASVVKMDHDALAVSAVVFSVLPGVILGAREILKTYENARTEASAAARKVDAAIEILTTYALLDDPAAVSNDSFKACSSMSPPMPLQPYISSNAFGRLEPLQDAKAKEAAAAAEVEKRQEALRRAKETLGALNLEKASAEKRANDIETARPSGKSDDGKGGAPPHESAAAKAATEEINAKFEEAAQLTERRERALENARRIAELRALVTEKTTEVMEAYAKLRRAVLFQAPFDVEAAFDAADHAKTALRSARSQLETALDDDPADKAPEVRSPAQTAGAASTSSQKIAPLSNPYLNQPIE